MSGLPVSLNTPISRFSQMMLMRLSGKKKSTAVPVYPPIDPNEEGVAAVVEEAAVFRSRLVFFFVSWEGRKSLCGVFSSLFLLMDTFII